MEIHGARALPAPSAFVPAHGHTKGANGKRAAAQAVMDTAASARETGDL